MTRCQLFYQSGNRKGQRCEAEAIHTVYSLNVCGRHFNKAIDQELSGVMTTLDVKESGVMRCQGVYKSGRYQGLGCDNPAVCFENVQYLCGLHRSKSVIVKNVAVPKRNIPSQDVANLLGTIIGSAAITIGEHLIGKLRK